MESTQNGPEGDADDELHAAGVSRGPDIGAGLLRHLNSEQCNDPSNNLPAGGSLIHNSMQASSHVRPIRAIAPVVPTYQHAQAPADMPPWLAEIHSGLQSLHSKADRQYAEIQNGLHTQGLRITHVESVTSEHTDLHQQTARKIKTLEDKVRELEQHKDAAPRSPRTNFGAPRSPRSPRSPRNSHFGIEPEDEPDMDLVIGGWVDARRDDAIEETKNILRDAQVFDQIEEAWAPYSRTSFVKLRLIFEKDIPIALKRRKQSSILESLRPKST